MDQQTAADPSLPPSTSNQAATPPAVVFRAPTTGGPRLGVRPPRSRAGHKTQSTPPSNPGTAGSPAGSGPPRDPIPDHPATGTRSPGSSSPASSSTPPGAPVGFDRAAIRETTRGLLHALTLALHSYLAQTEAEKADRVWIADDEDKTAIADPLASMAARRGGPTLANPDAADMLTAAFGVVAYGVKHGMRAWSARKGRKKLTAAVPDLVEHPEIGATK